MVENIQIPLSGDPRSPRGVVTQDLKKKLDDALKPKAPAEDPKADVAPKA